MGSLFEKWKKGLKKKVHPFCTAIVPAAGKSSRMGGEDKMFAPLCGVPVLARTLTVLDQAVLVDEIVVAAQPEKLEEVAALVSSPTPAVPPSASPSPTPARNCWRRWRPTRTWSIWQSTTGPARWYCRSRWMI